MDDYSVDEAAKKVIEVTRGTTNTLLNKAADDDIPGFRAFTIRNLDNKLSTAPHTEQYKVLNVMEDPIDIGSSISMSCAFRFSCLLESLVDFTPV